MYQNASDGLIKMYAGSSGAADVTTFNPSGDWRSAWQGTFSAETHETASDIVGVQSNHTKFSEIQRYNGSGWVNVTSFADIADATTRYHKTSLNQASDGSYYFGVWTYPLNSL